MQRFNIAFEVFQHAIDRARQMVSLFDALMVLRPRESANFDALRSAYIQTVSSFDFFVHELAIIEAKHRLYNRILTRNIMLPMEVMTIDDLDSRVAAAENHIRLGNSFKAFVDPAKLAEILSCYCEQPWQKICEKLNTKNSHQRSVEHLKGQLKSIWKRRNQIAHEADVNPILAGVSLWPIDKPDTELTIDFILCLGKELPFIISEHLPAP